MNFYIDNTEKIDYTNNIILNYPETPIIYDFEKTLTNGGYIKLNYIKSNSTVEYSVSHSSLRPTKGYKSTKLHIYKKTHDIKDVEYDGELVIENESITNGVNKVYVCIPLKTGSPVLTNTLSNPIDGIIDNSRKQNIKTVNINLNTFIKHQPYIFYKNGSDIIVVCTLPIIVKNSFIDFTKSDLFPRYSDDYTIINKKRPVEGSASRGMEGSASRGMEGSASRGMEGFTEGLVTECTPITSTGKEYNDSISTYVMDGKYRQQTLASNSFFMIINMFIIVFITFFISPFIYKNMLIYYAGNGSELLSSTVIFIGLVLILIAILVGNSFMFNNNMEGIVAMATAFILVFSMGGVINKTRDDKEYMKNKLNHDVNISGADITNVLTKLLLYMGFIWTFFTNNLYWILGFLLVFICVCLLPPALVVYFGKDAKTKKLNQKQRANISGLILGVGSFYGMFLIMYLIFISDK
jgi:hypothetical protein